MTDPKRKEAIFRRIEEILREEFSLDPEDYYVIADRLNPDPTRHLKILVEIILQIVHSPTGDVPNITTGGPEDKIPWRLAQWARHNLPATASHKAVGNRPKKRGYFYRFIKGNTRYPKENPGDPDIQVYDGDFEFEANTGYQYVNIKIDQTMSPGWEFDDIALTSPLSKQPGSVLPATEISLIDDTDNTIITSGRIGMVVRKHKAGNQYDYLYVDPDWDNRN